MDSMTSVTLPLIEEDREEEEAAIQYGVLPDLLGHHLRLAYEASRQSFALRASGLGLRPGSFSILYLIRLNPGITQTALSRASARDKSTLTPALRYLEEAGLVRREQADNDRRSYRLFLTPKGEAAAGRLVDEARAHDRELSCIIGPNNRENFLSALQRLTSALQASDRAFPPG